MDKYVIEINGVKEEYPIGTSFEDIAKVHQSEFDSDICIAVFNGKIRELSKLPNGDGKLEFLDRRSPIGNRTYRRSATLLFIKAAHDVLGDEYKCKLKLEFAVNTGYYFSYKGDIPINEEVAAKIESRMKEMVEADLPILKSSKSLDEAKEIFTLQNMPDKVKLCEYRRSSVINVYDLEGYVDYYYGHMFPSCRYISSLRLYTMKTDS